ncbi:MAG: hypothetical protein GY847_25410 [Proteobacteria bacterium]|nr:hypothetical protein [Pseudomonadota bacterium]
MKAQYFLTVALTLLVTNCGSAQTEEPNSASQISSDVSQPAPAELPAQENEKTEAEDQPGTILRTDLNKVLADGPAAILGRVLTEPVFEKGKFVGFRITEFTHGTPEAIDIRTGDVILRINGRMVERPEVYFEIFQELKVAGEISFELLRNGEEQTITYPVVD